MKALKIILLSFAAIVFAAILFVWIGSQDETLQDDSDLVLAPEAIIAPEVNAHYILKDIVLPPAGDPRAATDAFIAAANRSGYQCPTTVNDFSYDVELCELNRIRDLAALTAARATSAAALGNSADAVISSVAILQMANLLAESQGPLIEELVVLALYRIGYDTLVVVTDSLSPSEKMAVVQAIDTHGPDRATLADAHRYEYMMFKSIVASINHDSQVFEAEGIQDQVEDSKNAYTWHPNRTTNNVAKVYRIIIGTCVSGGTSCEETLTNEIYRLGRQTQQPVTMFMSNSIGRILVAYYAASVYSAAEVMNEIIAEYAALSADLRE